MTFVQLAQALVSMSFLKVFSLVYARTAPSGPASANWDFGRFLTRAILAFIALVLVYEVSAAAGQLIPIMPSICLLRHLSKVAKGAQAVSSPSGTY
jgi:hypothetical protein